MMQDRWQSASLVAFVLSVFSCQAIATGLTNGQHSWPKQPFWNQLQKSIAYYVDWAIYARGFHPQNLTVDTLTHVHYAFANVSSDNGTVFLSDPYADFEKKFPTDSANETGSNLYGCLKQLYLQKKRHRHLKTILSIGGATFTENFANPLATASGRSAFVNSSVALLGDLGFDGLEFDWESPTNASQAENFVSVLKELRGALDQFSSSHNLTYKFLLAAAVQANPKQFNIVQSAAMDKYLDYWNLMAYDYAGPFNNLTGHASNLYPSYSNNLSTPFSTQRALNTYLAAGVPRQKIVLGMPLYGRAFLDTTGWGKPYHGVGNGSWGQEGIWDYKALPRAYAEEVYDPEIGASYSYELSVNYEPFVSSANGTVIGVYGYRNVSTNHGGRVNVVTYDNKEMAVKKAEYILKNGLGGGMWWESSGDKAGDDSLIATVARMLERRGGLDRRQNWLRYPMSRYENLRKGMPGDSKFSIKKLPTTSQDTTDETYPMRTESFKSHLEAVDDLLSTVLLRKYVEINHDPTQKTMKRRLDIKTSKVMKTSAKKILDPSKNAINRAMYLCDEENTSFTTDPIIEEVGLWQINSRPELRMRHLRTLLMNLATSQPKRFASPINYRRTPKNVYIVEGMLWCFDGVADLQDPPSISVDDDDKETLHEFSYPIHWLAVMICRSCSDLTDVGNVINLINHSGFLGHLIPGAIEDWTDTVTKAAKIAMDEKPDSRALAKGKGNRALRNTRFFFGGNLEENAAWDRSHETFGFFLPSGEGTDIRQLYHDANIRFESLEQVYKEYFVMTTEELAIGDEADDEGEEEQQGEEEEKEGEKEAK
ncbi:MAG: hypothetical protein Q9181_003823 [Wetmoreana brouardii]